MIDERGAREAAEARHARLLHERDNWRAIAEALLTAVFGDDAKHLGDVPPVELALDKIDPALRDSAIAVLAGRASNTIEPYGLKQHAVGTVVTGPGIDLVAGVDIAPHTIRNALNVAFKVGHSAGRASCDAVHDRRHCSDFGGWHSCGCPDYTHPPGRWDHVSQRNIARCSKGWSFNDTVRILGGNRAPRTEKEWRLFRGYMPTAADGNYDR